MITLGVDLGSNTVKAALLSGGRDLAGFSIRKTSHDARKIIDECVEAALSNAGLTFSDIGNIVATGYGRVSCKIAHKDVSEITCHGKGAFFSMPGARTIIDIGGQDSKVISLADNGRVIDFVMNDKCAAGTGRFLEVMAKALGVELSAMGELSLRSKHPVTLANACTVWAQADVIKYLHGGVPIEDIVAGINNAMAARMGMLVRNLGMQPDVCMTGGVAKNGGVIASIEKLLGVRLKRLRREDPQIAGAIGAALFAAENSNGGRQ